MKKNKRKSLPLKPTEALLTINQNAAGIDMGSEEMFVCVPPDRDTEFVKKFETFTIDLIALVAWLKKCRITTVAIEATGIYWIPVFEALETAGFEVCLVSAFNLKRRKKTDVLDCQWIQQMHSYGLLDGSFRPKDEVCILRSYVRQRDELISMRSVRIQHMQKALHQMNIQLDNVITDITGQTGLSILRAIIEGTRDPKVLSQLRDPKCKNSQAVIEKSLQGNYRPEHVFQLQQALEGYDFLTRQIGACLQLIQKSVQSIPAQFEGPVPAQIKPKRKNSPVDQDQSHESLFRVCGMDLTAIPGFNITIVQKILSEIGPDVSRFPSENHFTSWLTLCPNLRTSGGKKTKNFKIKRHRASLPFLLAARSLSRSQTPLGEYYRRMRARLGPAQALVATAHKLARIVYFMLKNRQPYDPTLHSRNESLYQLRSRAILQKRARALGFKLVPIDVVA